MSELISAEQIRQAISAPTSVAEMVDAVQRLFEGQDLFYGHGTENAADEAYTLVFAAVEQPFGEDEALWQRPINNGHRARIADWLDQRINRQRPLPYITGTAWFAGLPFTVDERVLIPRSPIAELIETHFSPWLPPLQAPRVLDLCTGSGCIAIATALYLPDSQIDAADISADALAVAAVNVQRHGVSEQVRLIESDLFAALGATQYDLILSNPPYVPASSMRQLPDEYHHEPVMALEAADEGLAIVDRILQQAADHLTEHGILIVEVGEIHEAVAERYPQLPFVWLEFEHGGEGVFLLEAAQLRQV